MADALVLGASTIWCVGSSPIFRTSGQWDLKTSGTEETSSGRFRPRATKGARRPRVKSHFPHQRTRGLEGLRGTERTSSGRPRPRTTKGARHLFHVPWKGRIKSHFPHQRKANSTPQKQLQLRVKPCSGSNRLHLFCAANLLSVSPYPKRCRCSVFSYQKEEDPL